MYEGNRDHNAQKYKETLEIRSVARAKPTRGKPSNPFLIESLSTREIQVINKLTSMTSQVPSQPFITSNSLHEVCHKVILKLPQSSAYKTVRR